MITEKLVSDELSARLACEGEVRAAALSAAYDAARLTREERKGAQVARAALRQFREGKVRTLSPLRKDIRARFGTADLEYLARYRGKHPLVLEAIAATYRHNHVTAAQCAAYGRLVDAERALERADDGPLYGHAVSLEQHFGTRDVFDAAQDSLRYLRPGAI